jgi:hypothetical protein
MEQKRKMQRTGPQGSNTRFCVGSSSRGPVFHPLQQSGQPRVQAASQGFQTPQRQIQLPTSNLLDLHSRRRGTIMHKTLVLWDRASVVVRVGTTLIGVQGSRQIRRQPQAQIKTSTAMPTTVHLLQQGRTKLVLV